VSHEIAGTYGLRDNGCTSCCIPLRIQADELITTEKPTKPMHRVRKYRLFRSRKRVSPRNPFSVRYSLRVKGPGTDDGFSSLLFLC
jgi:hypothetical protein